MREIKFRGKRIDNGEWVEGAYVHNGNRPFIVSHDVVDYDEEYIAPSFWWRVDPSTVGQYTGFKDRNGTEIYEGDIIFRQDEVGPVEFSEDGSFLIRFPYHLARMNTTWGPIEIIGNIHDNPELLGGAG